MRIGILGDPSGWNAGRLGQAAERLGNEVFYVKPDRLTYKCQGRSLKVEADGISLSEMDALLIRSMPPGSLEQVISRMDALWLLEAQGLPILNPPKSLEACVDKLLCTGRLTTNGIPTPATIACETVDTGLLGFAELGNDVVVKPVFGSEGNGLVRLTDPDTAGRVFRSLESIRSLIYLQEYVPNEGFDLRLLVLAGRVLGAMKRYVPKGEFRANASRGARCEAYEPSEEEAKLACRATKITGAVFAGVDLLQNRDTLETYCIEVNSIPGFQALEATGQEIAPAVIQHLMDMVGTAASAKASRRQ